jgi:hypothetical protein
MKRRKTMKRIRKQTFLILSLVLLVFAFSQLAIAQKFPKQPSVPKGEIKGTIYIKEVSGNNSHKFTCSNFEMSMNEYDSKTGTTSPGYYVWATGDFSKRQCSYSIPYLEADKDYKPLIKGLKYARNPKGVYPAWYQNCDQTSMEAYDPQVILRVKADKTHTFNFSVKKINCTVLK